ncbi:DUF4199 domain-containing protein [Winogradskyella jejuensis]|uniref:DUF4199 domain-containing protein n=1 Tax=Winogradskyella jejuensis TaxID=1089305 RepID=A0A1M5SX98_9FLAO|nr:DUF4199 domain-containing protein [Winogradskyella jejuensis]SHH42743.1 Protein of unknown function [Winogradskyella jejuensis]
MEKSTSKKIAINFGIISGLIGVAIGIIKYLMNWHLEQHTIEIFLGIAITVTILVLAFNQFKKSNGGFMSLGQALKLGMGIILISSIITIIFGYILMNVIEPDMVAQMQEVQMEKMIEQNPNLTQEQIDMSKAWSDKFSSPAVIAAMQLFIGLFFGFIITLITGLVMKRNNPAVS